MRVAALYWYDYELHSFLAFSGSESPTLNTIGLGFHAMRPLSFPLIYSPHYLTYRSVP